MKKLIVLFLIVPAAGVWGIILHPGSAELTDKPNDAVIGRWIKDGTGGYGSCVAISPNYIMMAKHQYGDANSLAVIGGVTYTIDSIVEHPDSDMQIVKLHSGNLSVYAPLYTAAFEIDKTAVLGGYGMGRGASLDSPAGSGNIYGYAWDGVGNTTLRWCSNKIEWYYDSIEDALVCDFDGLGEGGATASEGMLASMDSGGGWFIKNGGVWKLAGLSWAIAHHGSEKPYGSSAWYRDPANPAAAYPDYLVGLRISYFQAWMSAQISSDCTEPLEGDFNGDCIVDIIDLMEFAGNWMRTDCGPDNNDCQGSNFDGDNDVDMSDFADFAERWMVDVPGNSEI